MLFLSQGEWVPTPIKHLGMEERERTRGEERQRTLGIDFRGGSHTKSGETRAFPSRKDHEGTGRSPLKALRSPKPNCRAHFLCSCGAGNGCPSTFAPLQHFFVLNHTSLLHHLQPLLLLLYRALHPMTALRRKLLRAPSPLKKSPVTTDHPRTPTASCVFPPPGLGLCRYHGRGRGSRMLIVVRCS